MQTAVSGTHAWYFSQKQFLNGSLGAELIISLNLYCSPFKNYKSSPLINLLIGYTVTVFPQNIGQCIKPQYTFESLKKLHTFVQNLQLLEIYPKKKLL